MTMKSPGLLHGEAHRAAMIRRLRQLGYSRERAQASIQFDIVCERAGIRDDQKILRDLARQYLPVTPDKLQAEDRIARARETIAALSRPITDDEWQA